MFDEVLQNVPSAESVEEPIWRAEIVQGFVQIFSQSPCSLLEVVNLPTQGFGRLTHGFDIDFGPVLASLKANLSAFNVRQMERCVFEGPHIWVFCVLTVSRFLF